MQGADGLRSFCRLQHQGPTSHEVGMQPSRRQRLFCRLQHQGPTSHEVGMEWTERADGLRFFL